MDARANAATIDFESRFSGITRSDIAAKARKHESLSTETRQIIFQLSQFNLQLAFARTGTLCKNIENQCRAVNDFQSCQLL